MAELSLAASSGCRGETREKKGLLLFEERGHEIERIAAAIYMVPSSDGTRTYRVDYLNECCNCPDPEYRPSRTCKHIYCVGVALAKRRRRTFVCDGCGERTPKRSGYVVDEDNLTFFHGMRLCEPCAFAHGVL